VGPPYIPDSKVTSKAGRSVKDLIKEAEKHLWTALRLRPSSSEIAFALVQALIWQGKHGGENMGRLALDFFF
jgi:cytochrome c-type biogenesis protein CcmH/NrfG